MNVSQQEVEQLVGTKIKDLSLYQKAFTHKSALKEHENLTQSFETLEFMGDSVLGFVITKWLFDKFEDKQEGFLTKARTKLVRSETLASIALKLGLNKLVLMDEKGMRNEWNNNPKILEDVFEALVGAIYMDCGLLHAKQFILGIYENPEFIDLNCIMVDDNFKDHLMRYCQTNSFELPEYREQATIMEEGGILGFFLIELFSHIPDPGLRVPLVTSILLFLLLNVALVGFLFVYEVARILFLDIADVAGKGGIKLADSRLLRSERNQQANVLNFCFTGFAGQSMLLLALAMLTFWDSQYLPQGAECGTWEDSICGVLRKNALEELTWMLAAGGQIVFLGI